MYKVDIKKFNSNAHILERVYYNKLPQHNLRWVLLEVAVADKIRFVIFQYLQNFKRNQH